MDGANQKHKKISKKEERLKKTKKRTKTEKKKSLRCRRKKSRFCGTSMITSKSLCHDNMLI